jgi:hypothetical protein
MELMKGLAGMRTRGALTIFLGALGLLVFASLLLDRSDACTIRDRAILEILFSLVCVVAALVLFPGRRAGLLYGLGCTLAALLVLLFLFFLAGLVTMACLAVAGR